MSIRIPLQPAVLSLLFLQLIMMILSNFFFSTIAACNTCIAQGEWWRFITSLFIHVDLQHFLSNSICLLILGYSIEKQLGSIAFAIIFFTSGISGNILSYLIMPLEYIHAGASGGIFGLLGAQLFILYSRYRTAQPKELVLFSSIISILLLFTFFNPSANPISHLTGLLIGGIYTPLLAKKIDGAELI
ncbi:rhomboid family intramembrane serine protease [Bacillus pseudomycoides]|uniref:Rhomboid family intramembrane serine protease n=1 Tax=Bacillus pseudomycoides TaxID=64104 RepID=A0AA91VE38_9BACI|nr:MULTISPECIES: rhomboid family intramembrane serine protease [Bacillus]PEB51949.1 rhomboid family intramembrane serine protease [Bacillus sp. AFS098217]PED83362.1 rhomboid family intramembrane serine protease [Bacillus pseudomycoides]PEU12659.1 rhomboid family intramembrane serine protease [Bacillus sp. AFS019443]PEU19100.1 rhomboid family intramembrane serine protease [Bacillus sp. AFS014408]PFW65597.1 rhomboid family intramembrane serine protease [Bacillus sp. AFS075034]